MSSTHRKKNKQVGATIRKTGVLYVSEKTPAKSARATAAPKAAPPDHPLAHLAGSYADDPFWEEYQQAIRDHRAALDAEQ
jgi:hypothetical protein